MNTSGNNNHRDSIASTTAEDAERQMAERRARRKEAKRTDEAMEIDPFLLSCLSTELLGVFDTFLNNLLIANAGFGSLHCFQMVLNSLTALYAKQYPEETQTQPELIKEMVKSLLQKIFARMADASNESAIIITRTDIDSNNACRYELLCLLEMHLLLLSPTKAAELNEVPTPSIAKSPKITIINFIQKAANKKSAKNKPISSIINEERLTPTERAVKNIVARLRTLYLLYNDPDQFRLFMDDVMCDEFLEELPFYLVCIYEQLGMEMPIDLQPYRSQESQDFVDEDNNNNNGRQKVHLDLSEYRNKKADLLDRFLQEIEEEQENDAQNSSNKVGTVRKRKAIRRTKSSGKAANPPADEGSTLTKEERMMLAPKKQINCGKNPAGTFKKNVSNATLMNRSSLKLDMDELQMHSLASRRLYQSPAVLVPETPLKDIGFKNQTILEEEVVEQTPLGKISTDNPALATKLSEMLLREEKRGEKHQHAIEKRFVKEEQKPTTSSASTNQSEHQKTQVEMPAGLMNAMLKQQQAEKNKRPMTPSECSSSYELVMAKINEQQQAKRPRRRLFSPSRSSTNSSGISFPFGGGMTGRKS